MFFAKLLPISIANERHAPAEACSFLCDKIYVSLFYRVFPEASFPGPRFYAQAKSRKEGRSSLHAFPPHRPLKRLLFDRENSKIRAPVGKVGLDCMGGPRSARAAMRNKPLR